MADGERELARDTKKSKRLMSISDLTRGTGKVTPEQTAFYVDLFQKVTQTTEYKDYMEKQALKPVFLTGKEMLNFLEEDDKLNASLMNEAGFVTK